MMKNKEKYDIEDLKFWNGHIKHGIFCFCIEHEKEGWELEHWVSVLSILKAHVEEVIETVLEDVETEWNFESDPLANDFVTVHWISKKNNFEGDMDLYVPALIEVAFDDWSDAWLEQEVQEDD